MKKAHRLQYYLNRSWLFAGSFAVAASFLLFLTIGFYNYYRDLKYAEASLNDKLTTVARRISGELLIAPNGAPNTVANDLKKELSLANIEFGPVDQMNHIAPDDKLLTVESPAPFLEDKYIIRVGQPKLSQANYFNFSILLGSFLLIGIIVVLGLYLQGRYLKKHLLKPIMALVDTSTGDKPTNDAWPKEIQDISRILNVSFSQREQYVFSQIAHGVIHDMKTLLQPILMASNLANENKSDSRLKYLLEITEEKLPSLLSLINTTLDGSRKIPIQTERASLHKTMAKSLNNLKDIQRKQNIEVQIDDRADLPFVDHDPLQIERVFTNIIKNGFEATDKQPIDNRKLKISFSLKLHSFVGVIIEDSGHGLPENPDSVFKLLKSSKPHGSGLGLSVSQKIVEEGHYGVLNAKSSKALGGALFEVYLPISQEVLNANG